jgi:DNA repair protein RecN (Recombination protein N)
MQKKEFIEFQYNELLNLSLKPDDERLLEEEYKMLTTVTERLECVSSINTGIEGSGGQNSIEAKLLEVRKNLYTLSKFDTCAEQWIDDLENCIVFFSELNTFCSTYMEKNQVDLDTSRIDEINSKLAKIQRMKKKHLCKFDDLLKKRDDLKTQLESIENSEIDRAQLEKELKCSEEKCRENAGKLSEIRKKTSELFDASISEQMDKLGFIEGKWKSKFNSETDLTQNGFENISFEVCTNKGEPYLPLEKTASGGEISRLMLAVKTVLAENDNIPILIFDEIDTGIGGVLAKEVAKTMYKLSNSHQIICISHLHQIASVADNHYRVYKVSENGRTVTKVEQLNDQKKVEEISRMLGSDSTLSKRHAEEFLELRKTFH